MKRTALISGLCLALLGVGVTLASIDFSSKRVDRDTVSLETVQRGTLEIRVSANGRLLPRSVEQIAAQVSGRVARVLVRPGDEVTAGQILAELSNPQLIATAEEARSAWEGAVTEWQAFEADLQGGLLTQESAVTRAQFDLQRAQLQLEAETRLFSERLIAEIDYKRTQLDVAQLVKTHAIEESRLKKMGDNIQVKLAVKKSQITQLARAWDRAKSEAASLQVAAGIGGIVQEIGVDVGEQLQPGSPIGRMAQTDRLYAELKVPAREANEVRAGQRAVIDTRSGTVSGVVTRVDPGVTDGTVIVDVDLPGALPAGTRPQLQVEGTIHLDEIRDTLFVGKPAYVKSHADLAVYKLDADRSHATRVIIRTGKVSLNQVQVLQGLKAGDCVITSDSGEWQDEERILLN